MQTKGKKCHATANYHLFLSVAVHVFVFLHVLYREIYTYYKGLTECQLSVSAHSPAETVCALLLVKIRQTLFKFK